MLVLTLFSILLLNINAEKIPWVAFNGGGSRSGINTAESVISPTSVSDLSLLWSRKLTDDNLTWVYGSETIDSSPLFLPNVTLPNGNNVDLLFFNSLMGTLYAVNADTGTTVWQNTIMIDCETNDCITKHTPALDPSGEFVYCYRVDGTLRKYAVATGEEIVGLGFPVFMTYIPVYEQGSASANIIDDVLYMTVSGDNNDHSWYVGKVVAVDLQTGETNIWNALCSNLTFIPQEADCPVEDRNGAGIWSRGSVVDGGDDSIFVATGNGLFNANEGGFYWGDSLMRLRKGLRVADGPVILDSYTPTTYKDMQDKDYDLGSSSPCILPIIPLSNTPYMIVQASKDFQLRLLNREDLSGQGCCANVGGEVHSVPFEDGFIFNHPLAWYDDEFNAMWVFVTTTDNEAINSPSGHGFHAFQVLTDETGASTLSLNYTLPLFGSSPFMANGVLFQQTYTGLYALDPSTGRTLWVSGATGGLHWQSPIVVNGRVYTSDDSGNIYAWGVTNPNPEPNFPVWALILCAVAAVALVAGAGRYCYSSSYRYCSSEPQSQEEEGVEKHSLLPEGSNHHI